MDKVDALALLEMALKQVIHTPPPIPPAKIGSAMSIVAIGRADEASDQGSTKPLDPDTATERRIQP
jgi:hypothetical protein